MDFWLFIANMKIVDRLLWVGSRLRGLVGVKGGSLSDKRRYLFLVNVCIEGYLGSFINLTIAIALYPQPLN